MRTSLRLLPAAIVLLVASLVHGAVFAQTPGVDSTDPCAGHVPATPIAGRPQSGSPEQIPVIEPRHAVIGALTVHQQNVVTTLQVVAASSDDAELVSFATEALPDAEELLEALTSQAKNDATDHPAAMVAVLDELRQERDLPADQGGLDAYQPGSVLETLCRDSIDRESVAIQTLVANDTAVVEIAALGELVVNDDAIEIVDAVSAAASERLDWLDARSAEATPMATPKP